MTKTKQMKKEMMGHSEENGAFLFTEKDVIGQFQKAASRLRACHRCWRLWKMLSDESHLGKMAPRRTGPSNSRAKKERSRLLF